jgi:hypothetical protein
LPAEVDDTKVEDGVDKRVFFRSVIARKSCQQLVAAPLRLAESEYMVSTN